MNAFLLWGALAPDQLAQATGSMSNMAVRGVWMVLSAVFPLVIWPPP